jgi:TRAP transporter TAXI family solute receptor
MGVVSKVSAILIVVFLIVGVAVGYFAGSLSAPVTTITKTETKTITLTLAPTPSPTPPATPTPTTTPWPKVLSITTGPAGGVYFALGAGIADLISKYIPGVEASSEVTPGSVDNMKLIHAKKCELALAMSDIVEEAYKGIGAFEAIGKTDVRTVMALHTNYAHFVTLEGKGIEKLADLRGKRVSLGAPGSGSEKLCIKILKAAGIDPDKDIVKERLAVAEAASALKDGKIDAFFWNAGIPMPAVLDLATTPGIKVKLIPLIEVLPKLVELYGPVYFKAVIPKGTYPGIDVDFETIGLANLLVCIPELPSELVYQIVKVVFDHIDELKAIHKAAEEITLKTAVVGSPVPFHDGAIKYFKEKGVWKG